MCKQLRIADCGLRISGKRRGGSSIRNPQSAIRNESGQALVEYAIVFPLQLALTLLIIQLAHMFIAKQVIEYSAFCAARAGLSVPAQELLTTPVDHPACRRAALVPLSAIAGPSNVTRADFIQVPGWTGKKMSAALYTQLRAAIPPGSQYDGERQQLDLAYNQPTSLYLSGSGAADQKTDAVRVYPDGPVGQEYLVAEVKHDYELTVPIGGMLIGTMLFGSGVDALVPEMHQDQGVWYMTMTGTAALARPWGN